MRSAAAGVVTCVLLAAAVDPGYVKSLAQWRTERETKLKAPDSWLAVAGLFWLHEGPNKVGSDPLSDVVLPAGSARNAGVLTRRGERAEWRPASGGVVQLDEKSAPATFGSMTLTLIVRAEKVGVRLKDPNADTRRNFTGLKWYPADPAWRIRARWFAYAKPRTLPIASVIGVTYQEPSPGYADFAVAGKTYRLEPITEDDHLFFIFKDQTSSSTTYGAGRYLYAATAKDGFVELDFNKAENPPCAFTAFATCPLPPRQNVLAVAIPAGEMRYGKH